VAPIIGSSKLVIYLELAFLTLLTMQSKTRSDHVLPLAVQLNSYASTWSTDPDYGYQGFQQESAFARCAASMYPDHNEYRSL
jgi:hypothetical protein